MSVNLSARQFTEPDLVDTVRGVLEEAGVPAAAIRLGLMERMTLGQPEHAARVLQRLKRLGARLSLDDFGTGYSSLSHLKRFPLDILNVDRSLVAEGIEEEAQASLLDEFGQGFPFHRPLTEDATTRLLGMRPGNVREAAQVRSAS